MTQTAAMGALSTLRAATDPRVLGGQYYGPRGLFGAWGYPKLTESSRQSHDRAIQRRLWTVSEELTRVTFPVPELTPPLPTSQHAGPAVHSRGVAASPAQAVPVPETWNVPHLKEGKDVMSEQITEVTTATASLEHKTCLGKRAGVTGGTRGIGAAIAAKLSARGAGVVISARTPAEVPADGVELVLANAATMAGAERLASEAERVLGEVDIIVNNAGGAAPFPGGIDTIPDTEWEAAVAANLLSAVRLDRLLVPGMRARRTGVVIHIS